MAVSNDTLYSNSSCGRPREDSFVMLRDPINSDMPWAGFIFGQTIASIWYWCADQVSFVPFSEIFYMISNLHFCLALFNDISQNTILFIYYYFIGAERICPTITPPPPRGFFRFKTPSPHTVKSCL